MLSSLFKFGSSSNHGYLKLNVDRIRQGKLIEDVTKPLALYKDGEDVSGKVSISRCEGSTDHAGLRIELTGRAEPVDSKKVATKAQFSFLRTSKDLEPPGQMENLKDGYDWCFRSVEMPHETYHGQNVRLRYVVTATLSFKNGSQLVDEEEFAVYKEVETPPRTPRAVHIDVGIEDCLHIDLNLDSDVVPLGGTIVGQVKFTTIRLRLSHMELNIIRQETTIGESGTTTDAATVTRYELMDGTPAKGEVVPFRMHLKNEGFTPTMMNVTNLFSVRYFVSVVLVDEEERRYFKKHEIVFYRASELPTAVDSAFVKCKFVTE